MQFVKKHISYLEIYVYKFTKNKINFVIYIKGSVKMLYGVRIELGNRNLEDEQRQQS
jgi:hypothetical protein